MLTRKTELVYSKIQNKKITNALIASQERVMNKFMKVEKKLFRINYLLYIVDKTIITHVLVF